MFDAVNITNYFSRFSVIISFFVGVIVAALGGYDVLLKTLLCLTVLDFLTGVLCSLYSGKGLSSEYGFKGIIKKIFIYLTVAIAVIIEKAIGGTIPLREIVLTFYIVNEGISNLENIGKVIEYPEQLKQALSVLRGE